MIVLLGYLLLLTFSINEVLGSPNGASTDEQATLWESVPSEENLNKSRSNGTTSDGTTSDGTTTGNSELNSDSIDRNLDVQPATKGGIETDTSFVSGEGLSITQRSSGARTAEVGLAGGPAVCHEDEIAVGGGYATLGPEHPGAFSVESEYSVNKEGQHYWYVTFRNNNDYRVHYEILAQCLKIVK